MGVLDFTVTTTSKRWLSPILPNNPISSPSQRSRNVNFWRSSLQESFLHGNDQLSNQILIANAHGSLQSPNKDSTDAHNPNVSHDANRIEKNSSIGCPPCKSFVMNESDLYADCADITVRRRLELNLLIENLREVENAFNRNDLVTLERDILTQIGRLGALKMFHDCLSKTINEPSSMKISQFTDNVVTKSDKIVRSGKRELRKWRRARALRRAVNISSPSICAAKGFHPAGKTTLQSLRSSNKEPNTGKVLAKSESELSIGVKEVAVLEKIRERLENKGFGPVTYARWAEAAGLDQKTLQQRLLYGWECRDGVIKRARSLVIYIAKSYRGLGISFDDLLQAGNVGVLNGAERFDSKRGYRFSTYVQYWIRKSILALISRDSRLVRVPVRMENIIRKIQKARIAFFEREGRYPQDKEIADFVGISLANVRLARKCARAAISTEMEIDKGWNMKFKDIIQDKSIPTPDEQIMKQHIREDIFNLLESLDSIERQVLVLRYGFEDGRCRSLGEIGTILCLSREWIRQLQNKAFQKISREEIQRGLKAYLRFHNSIYCE